jgi:hypothetical protein
VLFTPQNHAIHLIVGFRSGWGILRGLAGNWLIGLNAAAGEKLCYINPEGIVKQGTHFDPPA